MQVSAKLNNLRIAPRKVRLVADLVRGLETKEAINQLENSVKGANDFVIKLIASAVANGENNLGLDRDNLKVAKIIVNEGPTLKRWMPRAFGRASTILKRTSKVELVLEEIEEGKNRKTKEQLEKERKARLAEKKKIEKEAKEKESGEEEEKKIEGKKDIISEKEGKRLENQRGNWKSRIFRRKSM